MHAATGRQREAVRVLGEVVLLALLIGVSAAWALRFAQGAGGMSTLWPSSGILCGVLLTSPRARWPWIFLAGLGAFVLASIAIRGFAVAGLWLNLADALEAIVVAFAVARGVDDVYDIARVRRSALIGTIASFVVCAITAAMAAAAIAGLGSATLGDMYATWVASHVLGMVIFATLTVVARGQGWRILGVRGSRAELLGELIVLAATGWLVFHTGLLPLPFLVFPPLLLIVFRHRLGGFVLGTALIAAIAASAHGAGHEPFPLLQAFGAHGRTLALQVFIACVCLLSLPMAVVLTERRSLHRRLTRSEREYRMLADYSRDMVVRFDERGMRQYVSPSAADILGWPREAFANSRWDLIHPEDIPNVQQAVARLFDTGGSMTLAFRIRHQQGHYVWIEAKAVRVPAADGSNAYEIIYSGRDISKRMAAQAALRDNERRLQAITANLPAFVMHIDTHERYTFVNAYALRTLEVESTAIIGRSVAQVVGEANYREIAPYMRVALRGEDVTFEIERYFHDRLCHYQSNYVPDVGEDGSINGFYAVSFDITELKRAQTELTLLARHDTLTGLANRHHFIERLELAVARSHRSKHPVALLYLDIDHFKQINDTLGHAAGDAVLREFARRLRHGVRDIDLVARLGGDEFVIVIEDIESPQDVQMIADKLLGLLDAPIEIETAAPMRIGASVGIALGGHAGDDAESLLGRADEALYEAKRAGRNVWRMAG